MTTSQQRAHSLAIGKDALGLIEHFHLAAEPRIYELCYRGIASKHLPLREKLAAILEKQGYVSDYDLETICSQLHSPGEAEQVGRISHKVADEIRDLARLIETALINATDYHGVLSEATSALSPDLPRPALRTIIETVLTATAEMKAGTVTFSNSLEQSRTSVAELQRELNQARAESLTDPLTGIANRRHFDQALQRYVDESRSDDAPLSLILADVDHFKSFNDMHGHLVGDQVLRLIALEIKESVKRQDFVARFGGEEFAVLLPGTSVDGAVAVARHIKERLSRRTLVKRSTGETIGRVTLSYGISCLAEQMDPPALINAADRRLYAAKNAGRDAIDAGLADC